MQNHNGKWKYTKRSKEFLDQVRTNTCGGLGLHKNTGDRISTAPSSQSSPQLSKSSISLKHLSGGF